MDSVKIVDRKVSRLFLLSSEKLIINAVAAVAAVAVAPYSNHDADTADHVVCSVLI